MVREGVPLVGKGRGLWLVDGRWLGSDCLAHELMATNVFGLPAVNQIELRGTLLSFVIGLLNLELRALRIILVETPHFLIFIADCI